MGCFWCWVSERLATDGDCCHICKSTGWGGRGVGVGGLIACFAVCSLAHTHTHTSRFTAVCCLAIANKSCEAFVRSLALAHTHTHTHHATLLSVLLHLHTRITRRCCTFFCTCARTSCDAAVRSYALTHTHTDTSCYVAVRSLELSRWWWWGRWRWRWRCN